MRVKWAGAALFAVSLLYFLYTYAVTFGETTTGPLRPSAVVIDVVLFSAFALHHSLFARERVRTAIAHIVSPELERTIYVWAASLMLIGVCAFWQPVPGIAWALSGPFAWLPPVVQVCAIVLTLRGAAVIDVWELAGVRGSGIGDQGSGTWHFKTSGPYGWVRHPIYLGWFLLVFGVATMTMTRLLFAVVSCVYILIAIPFEERTLRHASRGRYDDYMRQVRSRLVPGIY